MDNGKPSRTAISAAVHRALHIRADTPVLLSDVHALDVLGSEGVDYLKSGRADQFIDSQAGTRALIVARTLFAEETLARAAARGVDQYVLLGAGLDTFAHRNPWPAVRVFEVDYPATGAWKQTALRAAGVPPPANVIYVPLDFEREKLGEGLARAGFDLAKPAVFAWLGVVVYLTRAAITETLGAIAALPAGTEVVFEYGEPRDRLPEHIQARMKDRMDALAAIGEPWISFFKPEEIAAELRAAGFAEVEDLPGEAINVRWFSGRADALKATATTHLIRARV